MTADTNLTVPSNIDEVKQIITDAQFRNGVEARTTAIDLIAEAVWPKLNKEMQQFFLSAPHSYYFLNAPELKEYLKNNAANKDVEMSKFKRFLMGLYSSTIILPKPGPLLLSLIDFQRYPKLIKYLSANHDGLERMFKDELEVIFKIESHHISQLTQPYFWVELIEKDHLFYMKVFTHNTFITD
jgi:hypothetical protein